MATEDQTGNEPAGDAAPTTDNLEGDPSQTEPTAAQEPAESAEPAETDEVRGLRQAAEAERVKRQKIEEQLRQTQEFVGTLASQMRQQSAKPAAVAQTGEPDPLSGFTDDDLLDPRKVREALKQVHRDAVAEARKQVGEVQFQSQYRDFNELVGTTDPYTQQFRPSEVMQEAMQEDPTVAAELMRLGQTNPDAARVYAYRIAKQQKRLREARQGTTAAQTKRADEEARLNARHAANTVEARTAPMSPAAVSGATSQSTEIDWAQMARDKPQEFDAYMERVRRGEFG